MNRLELQQNVEQLLFEYADCLNEKRYEEFPAFFDEDDCYYEIQSKENYDLGLPTPLMGCYSHGMVKDRIAQLVDNTLTYRRLNLRHFVTNVRIVDEEAERIKVKANFLVMQSDLEGVSEHYLIGRYEDEIVKKGESLKFIKKRAILDSFAINNMLAVPV
jgi:anthranilate 1,2-dioxygenase small subunit